MDERFDVAAAYYTDARIFRAETALRAQTYACASAPTCYEAGLQIPGAAGWRPGCAVPRSVNVERWPPLATREGARLIFGSPGNIS